MHILLHKLELLVDRLIPPLLAVLLFVIAGELFFHNELSAYLKYADYFDSFIILVFALDLSFKFSRVRKASRFVRRYWMEIIATIPFFLVFRLTEFLGIGELLERSQAVAHEAAELPKLEREAAAIIREAGSSSRIARMARFLRAVSRAPRFLRVLPFFEKPTGRHHPHEKMDRKVGENRR